MTSSLFFSFIASLAVCLALIPVLVASAGSLHILDFPGGRKIHPAPIAKVGGVGFGVGALVAILLWAPKDDVVIGYLLGGLTIFLFGVWDDRVSLNYQVKFFGQLLSAGLVIWYGGIQFHGLPFFPDQVLPNWITMPLTLIFLLGVTNAVNLSDGLDGLAGGLTFLSFGGMTFLAYESGDTVLMLILFSVLGGLLGFMRFNTFPARVFMGDGGSQFLGLFLGVSALVLMDPGRGATNFSTILLLLGLPILDTVGVIIQRLRERRSPFLADRNHIHHKLLSIGFLHHEAVVLIYAFQAFMISFAYLLRWKKEFWSLGLYSAICSLILFLFFLPEKWAGLRKLPSMIRAFLNTTPHHQGVYARLREIPIQALGIVVPGFLLVGVFLPQHIPVDFGYFAIGLLGIFGMALTWAPKTTTWSTRMCLYIGTAFVVYLMERESPSLSWLWQAGMLGVYLLLGVLVILTIRFHQHDGFEMTPLDYLILFLAVVVPNLPEFRAVNINLGFFITKLIILFFSFELLLSLHPVTLFRLKMAGVCVFLGLAGRSLIPHLW